MYNSNYSNIVNISHLLGAYPLKTGSFSIFAKYITKIPANNTTKESQDPSENHPKRYQI